MDNQFKAPPVPPKAPTPVFMPKEHPQETPIKGLYDDNFAADLNLPAKFLTTKMMTMILGGTLLVGMLFGSVLFGGSSAPVVATNSRDTIKGVVPNDEITTATPRCGFAEKGQACLLYIQNNSRYDKIAEDFFDDVVRLMGVSKYHVSMVNVSYAKQRIRPGYIAQIKVPDVR